MSAGMIFLPVLNGIVFRGPSAARGVPLEVLAGVVITAGTPPGPPR